MDLINIPSYTHQVVEATFNLIFAITTIYAMVIYYNYKNRDQEGDM